MNRTSAEDDSSADSTVDEPVSWGFVECAVPGGLLSLVITWELTRPRSARDTLDARIVTCVAFVAVVAYLLARVRRAALELDEVRAVARAAQETLIRPLPSRLDGLALAARQISFSRSADVGGDLYEALVTAHGVRVVIGDVRGHGLPAIGAVAAVLGSFREAAHDESGLDGVLRRLDRAHQRHLRQRPAQGDQEHDALTAEEFVTVLLLEIGVDAEVRALNCGHPWPYRLGRDIAPLAAGEPLPPLGAVPLPTELLPQPCGPLLPGETLVLHTDGTEDARDTEGRFFGLRDALAVAALAQPPPTPATVVREVHAALLHHTGGRVTDDMALLVLRNDRALAGPG
ncbi:MULTISPECIES: PP2C family protein-serine/threonine phosphatase [unclassified Streptomyces]|uniref:PP2C family protein-serine/threonine phosphatase n=1 Tax=unclassified Streptomyces TaxID=2593676 RepID=UPI003808F1A3